MHRFLSISIALVAIAGCNGTMSGTCSSSGECRAGESCVDGVCRVRGDGAVGDASDPRALASVRVEPATATITSIDDAPATQSFRLIATRNDGTEHDATATAYWSTGSMRLGAIASTGTFTASGVAGGVVTVNARLASGSDVLSANATLEIVVERSVFGEGVDPATTPGRFGAPVAGDPSAATIVYPLEGAVMPQNVAPPDVQWQPVGAAGDVFRVRLTKPHATIIAYLAHAGDAFRHAWLVDRDAWRAIAESDADDDVRIEIDRLESATSRVVAGAAPRSMRLARGSLFGRVYFWDLSAGRTESIDPVSAARAVVVPAPAPAPSGGRCIACHTVSRDGRWLWGVREGDNAGMQFDLTTPLGADPAPTRNSPVAAPITMGTYDPTGTMLIGSAGWSGPMVIVDASTGTSVGAAGLPGAGTSFPSWSPGEGDRIAFMGEVAVAPDSHPIDGDVYVMPRTSTAPLAFGAPTKIHEGSTLAGAPEGGTADSHPVWSPDAQVLVFQHGPRTFSFVPGTHDVPAGALYRIAPDGTNLVRLDTLNGGPTGASSYFPTFAPYVTDEREGARYYWVAFYSRRDYGNTIAGTQGRGLRQLWVAAIDATAPAGSDPSLVPYWLPGQSTGVHNIAAYWAPEPCRVTGSSCATSAECCSETCEEGPDGAPVCVPPPETECRRGGMTCGSDEDCCDGATCIGNVCIEPPV
ncbi:dickkopf-related protein [Sandaracinus amylolyticus]|uniref:TolB protein n=1 Tax=Sandaracinus amylolyticus TaxID=927083 RepID=A0A0F6YJV5_9BACT|nr:dickkopf-related protein [Sandaracinus amylolyticus]AKF07478.1 tolB protein precursor [Sandaracinus amylolyticus]